MKYLIVSLLILSILFGGCSDSSSNQSSTDDSQGSSSQADTTQEDQVTAEEDSLNDSVTDPTPEEVLPEQSFEDFFTSTFSKISEDQLVPRMETVWSQSGDLYVIHRPGTMDVIAKTSSLEELNSIVNYGGEVFLNWEFDWQDPGLPDYNCEEGFTAEGVFFQEVSDVTHLQEKYKLMLEENASPNPEDLKTFQAKDAKISHVVVITQAEISLYFYAEEGKWKLAIIDFASFECGA